VIHVAPEVIERARREIGEKAWARLDGRPLTHARVLHVVKVEADRWLREYLATLPN
jgi:hypothetical protein